MKSNLDKLSRCRDERQVYSVWLSGIFFCDGNLLKTRQVRQNSVIVMTGTGNHLACFEAISSQFVTPHATGVECDDVITTGVPLQCSPVAEQDFFARRYPLRVVIPSMQVFGFDCQRFLVDQ